MTPVVKLLRLMDGEKPAMGKIYDRMFMIGQKIEERTIDWKTQAAKIHAYRTCTLARRGGCWRLLESEAPPRAAAHPPPSGPAATAPAPTALPSHRRRWLRSN